MSAASGPAGPAPGSRSDLIERTAVRTNDVARIDIRSHVTRLPAGLPSRVLELVDRIDRVEAITSVALAQPEVGVDPAAREPVLRRLVAVKDAARRSAVAAAGEAALRTF